MAYVYNDSKVLNCIYFKVLKAIYQDIITIRVYIVK